MSILNICDICGKAESTNIRFDANPLQICVHNHRTETYNIYLNVTMEHSDDSKIVDEYNQQLQNASDPSEIPLIPSTNLRNPHPSMCTNCKKELIKLSLSYGRNDRPTKI